MAMTPARRRRFQRTTRTNAGTSQRGITQHGFTPQISGSAGTAAATNDRATLWTEGRYILQAAQKLDGNRTVMRDRLAGLPSIQCGGVCCVSLYCYLLRPVQYGERAEARPERRCGRWRLWRLKQSSTCAHSGGCVRSLRMRIADL